eukprot:sb/3479546/
MLCWEIEVCRAPREVNDFSRSNWSGSRKQLPGYLSRSIGLWVLPPPLSKLEPATWLLYIGDGGPVLEVEVEFQTEEEREKWNEDVLKPAERFTRVLYSANIEMLTICHRCLYKTLDGYILGKNSSVCPDWLRGQFCSVCLHNKRIQGTLDTLWDGGHTLERRHLMRAFSERAVLSPARRFTRVLWSAAIEMLTIASRALYNTLSPYILYERVCSHASHMLVTLRGSAAHVCSSTRLEVEVCSSTLRKESIRARKISKVSAGWQGA